MQFANDIPKREAQILDAVSQGNFEAQWSEVTSIDGDNTAIFRVMSDALKVEGVRVNVSATLEQEIADLLYSSMLTAKLADLIFVQAQIVLPPMNRVYTSSSEAMVDQSTKLEEAITTAGWKPGLIVSTVGKHWILDNNIADGRLLHGTQVACNYGWHFRGSFLGQTWEACATGLWDDQGKVIRVVQGRGTRHNRAHADYSQNCVLVSRTCSVNGAPMDLRDLLQDPALAPLASHQGVLKAVRQPGVKELQPVSICP